MEFGLLFDGKQAVLKVKRYAITRAVMANNQVVFTMCLFVVDINGKGGVDVIKRVGAQRSAPWRKSDEHASCPSLQAVSEPVWTHAVSVGEAMGGGPY